MIDKELIEIYKIERAKLKNPITARGILIELAMYLRNSEPLPEPHLDYIIKALLEIAGGKDANEALNLAGRTQHLLKAPREGRKDLQVYFMALEAKSLLPRRDLLGTNSHSWDDAYQLVSLKRRGLLDENWQPVENYDELRSKEPLVAKKGSLNNESPKKIKERCEQVRKERFSARELLKKSHFIGTYTMFGADEEYATLLAELDRVYEWAIREFAHTDGKNLPPYGRYADEFFAEEIPDDYDPDYHPSEEEM